MRKEAGFTAICHGAHRWDPGSDAAVPFTDDGHSRSRRRGDAADRLGERRLDHGRDGFDRYAWVHDHPEARAKSRVSYTTVRDTARTYADFLVQTGSVRFAGNKLTKTVSVTIVGDALDEPDETFFLELTGATGATIDDGEGIGRITDDDLPPVVQVPSTLSVPGGRMARPPSPRSR